MFSYNRVSHTVAYLTYDMHSATLIFLTRSIDVTILQLLLTFLPMLQLYFASKLLELAQVSPLLIGGEGGRHVVHGDGKPEIADSQILPLQHVPFGRSPHQEVFNFL